MKIKQIFFYIITAIFLHVSCTNSDEVEDKVGKPGEEQPEIPDEYKPGSAGDIENDIMIYPDSGEDNGHEEGYGIENTLIGDTDTGFNTPFGQPELPAELEYFFNTDSIDVIDYLILYPLSDEGASGRFGETSVYLKSEGDDDYVKLEEYDFEESSSPQQIVFPDGWKDPESIKIKVYSGSPNPIGNDVVSLGEIEFYKENPSLNAYLDIFEDKSATKLKSDVSIEDIENIDNEFIQNMALAIHEDVYDDFRIGEFKSYPRPEPIAEENKMSPYGFFDNATGIYVKWGTEMVVFMDDFDGDITLRVIDHTKGFNDGKDYILKPGINRFDAEVEGLAYLIYQDEEEHDVKANFATGKINGYYDVDKNDRSEWQELIGNAGYDYFDVLGERAMLSFTTEDLRDNTDDVEELIELYDNIVEWEDDFIGLYKYDRVPQTRAYFRTNVHQEMWMWQMNYVTEYTKETMPGITNVDQAKTNPWGLAHELGHAHQTHGFNWTGMGEVGNNVLSQYILTKLGNESKLQGDEGGTLDYESYYSKGFTESLDKEPHALIEDVFVKLISFWQLQIYFDEVVGESDFYKDLFEHLRTHDISSDPAQQQVDFVKIASEVAGVDLYDFFKAWGFLTPMNEEIEDYASAQFEVTQSMIDEVKNYTSQFPTPDAKVQFITDNNVEIYQSKGSVSSGTVNVSGDDIDISGVNNAVVYQQVRDDEVLRVSTESSFEVGGFEDGDKFYAIGYDGEKKELAIQ